jgi:uncharacterized membrane protein
MNRNWFTPAIWLMWLALPITALKYWLAWDHLPMQMAVHFNAAGQPNGWETRQGALQSGPGAMAVVLVFFTVMGLMVRALRPAVSWFMVAVFYVVLGFLWYGNKSIVDWNSRTNPSPRAELVQSRAGFSIVRDGS